MVDDSIEYKSIIMRFNQINQNAYLNLSSNVEIEYYQKGMEVVWAEIQKNAGEFNGFADKEVSEYFMKRFGNEQSELSKRCIFLKEKDTDRYIGTCMAWFEQKDGENVSVIHWLAVDDVYSGRGYARMLITQVLNIYENQGEASRIYLHTQPCSYRAIKLYNDFGFCISKTDTYGTAINQYEEALTILKKYMTKEAYSKLVFTTVLQRDIIAM